MWTCRELGTPDIARASIVNEDSYTHIAGRPSYVYISCFSRRTMSLFITAVGCAFESAAAAAAAAAAADAVICC